MSNDPNSIDPNAGTQQSGQQVDVAALQAQVAQGQQAARENAFLRAGVDLNKPLNQALFTSYPGELTTEAIQKHFGDLNVPLTDAAPAAAPAAIVDDGQQAMRDMTTAGGVAAGAIATPELDPREQAWSEFHNAQGMARNRTSETRQLEMIDKFISGAAEGKKEFIFDEPAWRAEAALVGHDFRPIRVQGQPVDR